MADLKVSFDVRFSPAMFRWGLASLLVTSLAGELSSESVTLTTYYPAPSGVYTQMITTQNTFLARDSGHVDIGLTNGSASNKLNVNGAVAVGTSAAGYSTTAAPANGLIVQGSMGLGTAAPTNKLDVVGGDISVNGQLGVGALRLYSMSDTNHRIYYSGATNSIHIDSFAQMYFNQGFYTPGRVGIGNAAPSYALDVSGDIRANGGWLRNNGNQGWYNDTWGGGLFMQDATWIRGYAAGNSLWMNSGAIATNGGISAGYGGGTQGGGYINASARIGVGTLSAMAAFDAAGDGVFLSRQGGCYIATYGNGVTNCAGGYYATMTGGFYANYGACGGNSQPLGQYSGALAPAPAQYEGQFMCCPLPGGGAYW